MNFLSDLHYFCAQTDGNYKFPNSMEGDLLKKAKAELDESVWHPIVTVPQDGTEVLIGHWFNCDESNPYEGVSRWCWIVMGSYEDGTFWNSFNDEIRPITDMTHRHTATHWRPLPQEPQHD